MKLWKSALNKNNPSEAQNMSDEKSDKRRLRSIATRRNIIESALACYKDVGIEKTTMDVVAKHAGIGRATLYRHFTNQEEILAEVVLLEMSELQEKIIKIITNDVSLENFLVESSLLILVESPKKAITSQLFDSSATPIISRAALTQDLLQEMGMHLLTGFYEKACQQGRERDGVTLNHMVEWVTRFLVSYLSNPSPLFKTKTQKRELIVNGLLPILLKDV